MNVIDRVAQLLSNVDDNNGVIPPTDLYNEGWMLRLVIDWFDQNRSTECDLQFTEGARWYSEALLPSAFLPRQRGDKLAESWTHADGAIGHFQIGRNGIGDLSLSSDATQLIITEAKMFSKLSAGVTNARFFNQAARNVACIAEIANRANISPSKFNRIGFYVIAPNSRIAEGVFEDDMVVDNVRTTVERRVSEYGDNTHDEWFENWFLPTLDVANIRCISWEEILKTIESDDPASVKRLRSFYEKCLKFNEWIGRRY